MYSPHVIALTEPETYCKHICVSSVALYLFNCHLRTSYGQRFIFSVFYKLMCVIVPPFVQIPSYVFYIPIFVGYIIFRCVLRHPGVLLNSPRLPWLRHESSLYSAFVEERIGDIMKTSVCALADEQVGSEQLYLSSMPNEGSAALELNWGAIKLEQSNNGLHAWKMLAQPNGFCGYTALSRAHVVVMTQHKVWSMWRYNEGTLTACHLIPKDTFKVYASDTHYKNYAGLQKS